ncbi:hypothetical protein [Nonomuraea cavernae]|uniref:Peptidase n=1 Tax=Nonomuraea cavernae TaxID=2045107 RepID=A0A917Z4S1_9ACTN|nr:hypothetical protein [Nonomuraea cavernae]MCA2187110.1 DUF916 domain-containing protein [Nonomuraea cavernae]GGO74724.1 hypothetical protein GCM10012289_48070 [Nonomuraea cavernae]
MPDPRIRRAASATLLALLLQGLATAPAALADGPERPENGTIGIRLVEIPASRVDDPRARNYIVDHVNPGTTFTRRVEVTSTSPKPVRAQVYAGAAGISKGRFTFEPAGVTNELTSWISLNRPEIVVKPHSSETVKATITVPEWAGEGERYAVIWAQVSSGPATQDKNVALVNRIGIRTLLDVGPGGEPPTDFEIGDIVPHRTEDGHPQIVTEVANTGERAIDVEGLITLSDGPSELSAGPFPVDRGTTLAPGDRANVSAMLGEDLPDGPWKFTLTLRSGRVERTADGTLTFPAAAGGWGLAASLDSPPALVLTLTGLPVLLGTAILLGMRRRRMRRRIAAEAAAPQDDLV